MKYFLYISAPLFFCLALSSASLHAQAPACDSLAYFAWSAQCNSVTFTPNYISPTVSYSWTFGDGGTSTTASPTHLYNNPPGTYTFNVNLSVVSGACMDDTTIMVMVTIPASGGVPAAGISLPANPDLCAPAAITFANPPSVVTGNGPGTSYTYTVETGTGVNCPPPFTTTIPHTSPFTPFTHTFLRSSCDPSCVVTGASPGSFRVIMVATNSCGTTRDTLEVRIASEGTLGFTAPTVAFAGDQVCLADTSTPGYAWNAATQMCGNAKYWEIMPSNFNIVSGTLGNVNTPGSSSPCIRFTQFGTYMISQIRPAGSCPADTVKSTITVKPPCDSLANFTSNVTCNSVTFTPTFIDPSATYTWNFGDGSSSNEISPTHFYLLPISPQYSVNLTVISGSCINNNTVVVPVSIAPGGLPFASMISLGLPQSFTHCLAIPSNPAFNLGVQNTSSNVTAATMYNINWGDGMFSTPNPFGITGHLFTSMGTFPIVLTAVNQNGCVDTAQYTFFNGREPGAGIGIPPSQNQCVLDTIQFEFIPSMAQNPPGTIYIITVETPCEPLYIDTLLHTDPLTQFQYVFNRGSCEPDCLSPTNPGTFLVTVEAKNACGSLLSPTPPRISLIEDANFDLVDQACVGDTVCAINTSDTSHYWNQFDGECDTLTNKFWTISPPTGFTLTSGSLGIKQFNVSGSDDICLNFLNPGTYTVTLENAPPPVNPCPGTSITKTICILPQPIANFNFQLPAPACAPNTSTITFNNSSNTLTNCRPATYTWEVEFIDSECDTVGAYTFLNNTNANSISPTIRFDLSGRYLIRLIVENDCGIDSTTQEVTFGGTPFATITHIDDACGTLMVTPTVESTNSCNGMPPNFQWIIQNPLIPTIFDTLLINEIPGTLDYNIPGTYIIRLTAIGGCGNSTSSDTFTIHPIPAPPQITSNTPVCQGQCLAINVQNPNPIFEYVWETPCDPPGTVNTANVLICPADPSCTGLYQLTVTDPSSTLRCSLIVNTSALVYDAPPFDLQLDTIRLCSGESGTIQVINGQPNYTYQWTPDTLLSTTSGPIVIVNDTVVTIQTVLNYTVTVTDTLGCSATAVATVIVNPLPIVAISPPGTACAGDSLQLNATSNHPGTGVWTTTPGGTFIPPDQNPTQFLSLVLDTYPIVYTFTDDNGCMRSAFTSVCVQPKPNASFSLNAPMGCAPFQVTTSNNSNSLNTCGITTYDWQVLFDSAECHNGTGILWDFETGSNANSVSPVINFLQSGVYHLVLTVDNDCGTSSDMVTVTVGARPQGLSIDPIDDACDSLFLTPTGQALSCNASGLNLDWFLDDFIPPSIPTPGIGVGMDGPHTVFMIASNNCGADTLATSFTIHPPPPVPVLTSNSPVCEGDDLVLTVSSPIGAALEYCWTRPGLMDTCVIDTFLIVPNVTTLNAGTYTVTVTNQSTVPACTSTATITVVVNPAPPITFQADTVRICSGQSGTLQVIQGGYTQYDWSPTLFLDPPTGQGQVVTVMPDPVTSPLTLFYTVTVENSLTCTNSATAVVIVNPLPVLAIDPSATGCENVDLPLSATVNQPGMGMWTSDPPGPMFGTPTSNPTLFQQAPQGTYLIKYEFTDLNGCSDSAFTSVCVQPQPIAQFTASPLSGCISPLSPTLQVSTTNTSNTLNTCGTTTYNWEVFFDGAECHSGAGIWNFEMGSSASSVDPVINFGQSGVYRLVLTVANDCGTSSTETTVTVGEAPQGLAIDPIGNECDSLFLMPTGEALACNAPGLSLTWFLDGIQIFSPPGTGVGLDGQHTVKLVAMNVCGTDSVFSTFTIHPLPPVPVLTYNSLVCERDDLVLTVNSPIGVNLEYCMTGPGIPLPGICSFSPVFTIPDVTPINGGLYTVTVRDTSTMPSCSASASITVVVNPAPTITFQADTVSICQGQSSILQVTETVYVDYQWSPTDSLNPTFGPVVTLTPGTAPDTLYYTVTVTDTLTCTNSATAVVIVHPLPVLAIALPDTACAGQALQLTATSNHPGTGEWSTLLPATVIPNNQNPTAFQGPQGTYPIRYVFTDLNGCNDSTFTNVCVQPQPLAQFTASPLSGCISPLSPTLQVSTLNNSNTQNTCGTTTYNWQVLFDGAECHSGAGIWNFEMGSSDTSLNPVINFGQSGVYRLVLTVENECGTSSTETTVTVGEAPQGLAIDSIGNACDTLFLVPTGQAIACNAPGLTLTWFLDNIPPAFSNPPGIGVGVDGQHTVTMVAANVCGADTLSTNFTIHPLPPVPVVTYNGPVCERDSLVFTVSSPTGPDLVYCWVGSNGLDSCLTNPVFVLPNATTANAGLYTVTVRDTSTVPACSASASIMVVVNPAPPITFQADTVNICSGQSGIIQVINGQPSYTYLWSPSTLLDTTVGPLVMVTPGTVTAPLTLYYTVRVTDTLTCTNFDTAVVLVHPLPVLAIGLPDTACSGVQLPLTATVSQLGIGVWTSDPTGPTFGTPTSNPSSFLTSDTGTYLIRYIFTDINGCIDSAFTSICVQPQPIAQFDISQSSDCISSLSPTLQVTTNNTSNTQNTCGTTTYNWQVLFDTAECHSGAGIWNFETGSSATSLNPVLNFGQSGVYILVLTVTNECGTSTATDIVTVGEAPQVLAINPINNACDNLFLMPTGQVLACNATGLTLSWYLDNSPTPFPNPPGILVTQDGQHTVKLVATNVCGADSVSTDFTIHPLPPTPVLTSNGPVCERDSLVFTVTSPIGPDFEYCWMGPNGLDTCVTDSFIIIPNATPANAGLYTVTVTNLSTVPACSASATITAVVNPAPPITFEADTVRICSGQSGTLQVNEVGYNPYTWSPTTFLAPPTGIGQVVTVTPDPVMAPLTLLYTVTVQNNLSCTNSATAVVIVNPLPVLAIVPPDTACANVQLPLSATVSQLGMGVWTSTPPGPVFNTSTSNSTTFTGTQGTYSVKYVFTDINGCIDSTFTSVCVQPQPIAQFTVPSTGCITQSSPVFQVNTNNTSNTLNTCGTTNYLWEVFFDGAECHNGTGIWNFETGSSATSVSPVINFGQSGVYRLVLTVDNECGTSSTTAIVTVGEAPQITSFATTPPVVCEPFILNPMAEVRSCNSPTTSLWSFSGSSGIQSSTVLDPGPIPYNVPGNYTVNLVATNACGVDSEAHTFRVQALPSITATATNTTGCVPVEVAFSNQPVTGVTYTWDFGDGSSPVTTPNPGTHTYSIPGTYIITITAVDAFGCSRTSSVATVQANPVPTPGFALAPTVTCGIPQSLCLTNNSTGATTYSWTLLPDVGTVAPIPNPCVTIPAAGNYVIQQVVSNQFGCTASTTLPYIAYDQPVASFATIGDSAGCEDLLIQFNNQSAHADFVQWQIDGKVVVLDSLNPSYLFTDPGEYTVTLTVGNGSGCTASLTRNAYIRVFPTPVAGFEFVPLPNEWPVTFRFRDKSSPDAVLFGWNFGETMDTVDSEEKNPKYRYFSTAGKLITHWVTNAFGCSDTITAPLSIDVDGDLFIPNILEPANGDHPEKQIFLPKGYNLSEYHIAVFARTGQLIWESTLLDANGHPVESWDGKLNGTPLPSGVFVWKVINAVFINGREWDGMLDENKVKRKTNFLYLIR